MHAMSDEQIVPLQPGYYIQLPAAWAEGLGLDRLVILEKTNEGILVRRSPPVTWDDIFATKLQIGSAPPDPNPEDVEVTGDDFLF